MHIRKYYHSSLDQVREEEKIAYLNEPKYVRIIINK